MKRIIVSFMIMMLMVVNMSSVKVQAMPVAIASSSASVMAMIIGLIPYLGVLLGAEGTRESNIDKVEEIVNDEMSKTNMTVQQLSNYTNANDADANNGTVLQNFLKDNAVMMAMQAGTGENYVKTYFTGVGQAQLFIKAILALSATMLSNENLDTYTTIVESGPPSENQNWTGVSSSPVSTVVYPRQLLLKWNSPNWYTLFVTNGYIYGNSSIGFGNTSGGRRYESYNGGLSWDSYSTAWNGEMMGGSGIPVNQANCNIFTDSSLNSIYFAKTTTSEQDGTGVSVPYLSNLAFPVIEQTKAIWGNSASLAVPDVETAMDVMEGTKTVDDVIGTYTAEGAIPMSNTIAGTLEGVVNAPEVAQEWSKENWTVPTLILTKFPFCIPWDLTNTFNSMITTAEPPMWVIDFPSNIFIGGGSMTIDFAQFETLAKITRWGVMIFFMIGLMLLSWRLKGS